MRFATCNIWNDAANLACRTPLLMREITQTAADIIALQEVPQAFFADSLSALSQYPWRTFRSYTGEEEGLAVLSRHPITDCTFLQQSAAYGCARALNVCVDAGGERISFTNVHLPWDSPLAREEQITAINGFLQTQQADHFLLLGDFIVNDIRNCL